MNIKKLAKQAGIKNDCDGIWCDADQLQRFAALVAAHEREAIADEYWSALLSDMEHGVKCLNIQAAKDFNRTMPELSKFGRWLNDRSDAHEEYQQVN
jgi:hypothetical protein